MDAIGSINSSTTQAAAVQAAQANTAAGTAQAQVAALGLPPANLAQAASTNTVNAELVSSQWGIDPASVSGVYGDTRRLRRESSPSAMLLPLLTNLSHANAEQALALIGITTPTPDGGTTATQAAAAATTTTPTTQSAEATPVQSGPTQVDPLWGQTA